MASRKISDLLPHVQHATDKWLELCRNNGYDILITCTYRSPEEQSILYAQGRTQNGKIVTNAKPGESAHQHKRAIDFCVIDNGKPNWTNIGNYIKVGKLAEQCGFSYAGNWKDFKEYCHIEYPND